MKNILTENMLRFGVKNLNKSNIKNLMSEAPEEGSDMVGLDSNHKPIEPIDNDEVSDDDQHPLDEAIGVNPSTLVSVYKKYDNMGSAATFDEIFKKFREEEKEPYNSFSNGCATKVSLALQAAGKHVPAGFTVQEGPMKGKTIQTSAMGLAKKLGTPDVTFEGEIKSRFDFDRLVGGILIYSNPGWRADGISGHATVYHQGNTVDGSLYHIQESAGEIRFWEVADAAEEEED